MTRDLDPTKCHPRSNQRLLGAGVAGALFLIFGLHTGPEPLRVEWNESEPPVDDVWEEIVEASVDLPTADLILGAFEHSVEVVMPAAGPHRARFNALGMDVAGEMEESRGGR